jgi:hypothetical protein
LALNQKRNHLPILEADFEKQCYLALEAFTKNRHFVFVNDKQYFHLNDSIRVEAPMEVCFLKITPLIGG